MTQSQTSHVPAGKHAVTPYLVTKGVTRLLEFIAAAFDADVYLRVPNADGTVGHAEARIGDSVIMAFDAKPHWIDTPSFVCLYVADVDATYARALAAGAVSVTGLATSKVIGDRGARVRDPLGNIWWLQTHLEDVTPDEMARRFGDPAELTAMRQAQDSFEAEMNRRSAR